MGNKGSTSKSDITLYGTCLSSITKRLKRCTRRRGIFFDIPNPFLKLPPLMINHLTETAVENSVNGLKLQDLYYLLACGTIQQFKLSDVSLSVKDFVAILRYLASKSQNLLSITIQSVNIEDPDYPNMKYYLAQAIQLLIKNSPKLEYLETSEDFDIKVLWKCHLLKEIRVNCIQKIAKEDFYDIIPTFYRCTQLRYIMCDIGQVLEHLHKKEFNENRLRKQYKIEKCVLRRSISDPASVNTRIVQIATLTCVNLTELQIAVKNYKSIHALSDFKCLTTLHVIWVPSNAGDFQLGLLPVLCKIGFHLYNISLTNFSNLDFSAIATQCPRTKLLFISDCRAYKCYKYQSLGFRYLNTLYLELFFPNVEDNCWQEDIVTLLSDCPSITSLCIVTNYFDDYLLNKILKKSKFSCLENLSLTDTNLSEEGIKNLIIKLKKLNNLELRSKQIDQNTIGIIVKTINASVNLSDIEEDMVDAPVNFSDGSDIEEDMVDD